MACAMNDDHDANTLSFARTRAKDVSYVVYPTLCASAMRSDETGQWRRLPSSFRRHDGVLPSELILGRAIMARVSNIRHNLYARKAVVTDTFPLPSTLDQDNGFQTVSPDELAFALSVFVAAANGQIAPTAESPDFNEGACLNESQRVFLLAELQRDSPPVSLLLSRPSERSLEATFSVLWHHYDGQESQMSICARVLGFHHLTLRHAGAYLNRWVSACAGNPEAVELHPAIIEALAVVPLSESGRFLPESFLAFVEKFASTHTA